MYLKSLLDALFDKKKKVLYPKCKKQFTKPHPNDSRFPVQDLAASSGRKLQGITYWGEALGRALSLSSLQKNLFYYSPDLSF